MSSRLVCQLEAEGSFFFSFVFAPNDDLEVEAWKIPPCLLFLFFYLMCWMLVVVIRWTFNTIQLFSSFTSGQQRWQNLMWTLNCCSFQMPHGCNQLRLMHYNTTPEDTGRNPPLPVCPPSAAAADAHAPLARTGECAHGRPQVPTWPADTRTCVRGAFSTSTTMAVATRAEMFTSSPDYFHLS